MVTTFSSDIARPVATSVPLTTAGGREATERHSRNDPAPSRPRSTRRAT
jgi:hypothetical protein